MSENEPDLRHIENVRRQIEADPEGFVAKRLPYALVRIVEAIDHESEGEAP